MKKLHWLQLIVLPALFIGCAASDFSVEREPQKKITSTYTSAFPRKDVSGAIESILYSVKRISASSTYNSYFFDGKLLTADQIRKGNLANLSSRKLTKNESVAGTAISIAEYRKHVVFLTCAHVVNFPDTLIEYVERDDLPPETYVSSISIKQFQRNLIYDLPNIAQFDIVDIDTGSDLALIELPRERNTDIVAPPLSIKLGDSRKLKWGSFVYIAGFPKGFPMLVRGIVSSPNFNDDGDFLTDALFNPGISGGIVLASRDNFYSFEWIGVASTSSATNDIMLVPDPSRSHWFKDLEPYSGTVFIERRLQLSYGITQAIPTDEIIKFLNRNRRMLRNLGFNLANL